MNITCGILLIKHFQEIKNKMNKPKILSIIILELFFNNSFDVQIPLKF
jgi:hypothetical protein